jgi:hypothetical protein
MLEMLLFLFLVVAGVVLMAKIGVFLLLLPIKLGIGLVKLALFIVTGLLCLVLGVILLPILVASIPVLLLLVPLVAVVLIPLFLIVKLAF